MKAVHAMALAAAVKTTSAFVLTPAFKSSFRIPTRHVLESSSNEVISEQFMDDAAPETAAPPKPVELTGPQYVRTLPGSCPPFEYFDPLNVAARFRAIDVKKFRESEVKHGRVAMLAFVGMFVQELAHPLFTNGGKDLGPAIYHMQAVQKYFALTPVLLLVVVGILEGNNIAVGWVKQPISQGVADMKEEYEPGNFGFDPLGLMPKDDAGRKTRMTQELNNGRLAMIATIGVWVQELIDGKTILGHLLS